MARKALSKKLRFDVFKRDGFSCAYCGSTPPKVVLHVDHIVPVAGGGKNDIDNLITSCSACNLGKGATPLTVIPQSLAEKAAETREREEQLRGYHEILEARRERINDESWEIAALLEYGKDQDTYSRAKLQSIKTFLQRLPFSRVAEAADLAASKGFSDNLKFSYFCGVCWNMIKDEDNA